MQDSAVAGLAEQQYLGQATDADEASADDVPAEGSEPKAPDQSSPAVAPETLQPAPGVKVLLRLQPWRIAIVPMKILAGCIWGFTSQHTNEGRHDNLSSKSLLTRTLFIYQMQDVRPSAMCCGCRFQTSGCTWRSNVKSMQAAGTSCMCPFNN